MPGGTELGDWTAPRGHRKEMRRAEPRSAPGDWKREDKCGAAEGGGGRAGEGGEGRAGAGRGLPAPGGAEPYFWPPA